MKLATLIGTLLSLGAIDNVCAGPDTVNWQKGLLTCYGGGHEWGWPNEVVGHINNACKGWNGNRGFYQDVYYKPWNQSPYSNKLCVNYQDRHVNFEIANLNPNVGFVLNNNDCARELIELLWICQKGGEWQSQGWWFRADPNGGFC